MRISDWSSDGGSSDLAPSGKGRSTSQMRISRNHGLQSPLVRAVPAVLVGMIAPDPLRIGPADVVKAGAGVQPQHLQGLAILAGKHLSVARNRLLHRRTGEDRKSTRLNSSH